jgi:fatty acid desaturase
LALGGFALIFNTGFGLVHEAEHFALHPSRPVNEGLGWLLGALFPGSFSLLRAAHLVHHGSNRNDRELIEYVKPGESQGLKTLHYYLCLLGVFWVGTPLLSLALCVVPGRAFGPRGQEQASGSAAGFLAFLEDLSPGRLRLEVAATVVFWGLVAWILKLALLPTLALYGAAGCFWSSQQFIYHVGTPRHLVEGTRNLQLSRPLAWAYLHYNHHLTHHQHPQVPWIWLPTLTEDPPAQPYFRHWLSLFATPPRSIDMAWPREFQARGPLPPLLQGKSVSTGAS